MNRILESLSVLAIVIAPLAAWWYFPQDTTNPMPIIIPIGVSFLVLVFVVNSDRSAAEKSRKDEKQ